eukprot:scaffold103122_cov48-Cyclotella_meneghiniana.AAC.1
MPWLQSVAIIAAAATKLSEWARPPINHHLFRPFPYSLRNENLPYIDSYAHHDCHILSDSLKEHPSQKPSV